MDNSRSHTSSHDKYIVVEGPIGVGKSSLARRLASSFDCSLVLEKAQDNPFLERFYSSPRQYALQTQLFFLFQRMEQIAEMKLDGLSQSGRISDFMLEKDPLFAQITLGDDEYRLYQQVYQNLNISKPKPDLVIYLQAPVEILQERVHKRRVRYEMGMDLAYLQSLSDAYAAFFHRYNDSPLLMVNATQINPVDNDAHFTELLAHIKRIEAGKHFFNPMA